MTPTYISCCRIFIWRQRHVRKKKRTKASITCWECNLNKFFSFAKIKNLPWRIKTVKNVSNYQISIGNLLSEVHIDAWTNLEAWNGGSDFGICQWRLINKFSVLNKVKIYSEGSKGNKIGDEIIWLLVISCYTRSIWSNILLPKLQRKQCWWNVSMMLFK